jgi:hypothetical protein
MSDPERQWTNVEDSVSEMWTWSKGTSSAMVIHRSPAKWHWEVTTYTRPNDWDGTKWMASGHAPSRHLAMQRADVALDHLFAGQEQKR